MRHLENRLRVAADWHRWPEIADVEIEKPIFVVGLPRTGSTTLHDLLAQAPGNRVPLTWECHLRGQDLKQEYEPVAPSPYVAPPELSVCSSRS